MDTLYFLSTTTQRTLLYFSLKYKDFNNQYIFLTKFIILFSYGISNIKCVFS